MLDNDKRLVYTSDMKSFKDNLLFLLLVLVISFVMGVCIYFAEQYIINHDSIKYNEPIPCRNDRQCLGLY